MLIFDVSTLVAHAATGPTGIDRVLVDVALALIDGEQGELSFCAYDRTWRQYRRVPPDEVRRMAEAMAQTTGRPTGAVTTARRGAHDIGGQRSAPPRGPVGLPDTRKHLGTSLGHAKRAAWHAARAVPALRADRQGRRRSRAGCFSTTWDEGATYCSLGMDFAHNDLPYLRSRRDDRGFRVAMTVYDLIPLVAPQLVTGDYHPYFLDLLTTCDHLFTISETTRRDLVRFSQEVGVALPATSPLPLGSSLHQLGGARPAALDQHVAEHGYVLVVGTVTMRKNHHLLLDAWNELLATHPRADVPPLVIAGKRGSLCDETMARIEREASIQGKVLHLPGPSDEELAWLYRHCTFTVFPSLYEGWGLPVTESHSFGKVCLASDRASLPEAGDGLAVHLDAADRSAWAEAIMRHWSDPVHRQQQERRVATGFHPVDASESAAAVWNALGNRGG